MATLVQPKKNLKQEVRHLVFEWSKFPIDYWWRKKYNVPFGSKQHREMSFFDMLFEFEENKMLFDKKIDLEVDEDEEYEVMSQDEIDKEYETIDIEDLPEDL